MGAGFGPHKDTRHCPGTVIRAEQVRLAPSWRPTAQAAAQEGALSRARPVPLVSNNCFWFQTLGIG